ncbi:biotin carboxylase N-terminal domain-containing protein [Rothia sp. ZJ1223]|uniref:acetyl/propionyl/methylcrotonyl-CoA carboxylase subunit alpha n=1 Tax=Rothia sp. ZJ1223 TaxID=2811098 RepID=UPI00195B68BF|nr:biotin carboxylase N-terminal domain-containing protein [Rothia sp. ZJ1223]MBM7052305.1 ATP-grasp domain-containing protein [Rothia sp. ZJ1223]
MRKILIANRGEIAVRIINACADAGFTSIAIYADADAHALHTVLADEAHALEGSSPAETYLNIEKVLEIAKKSGATDVHPGYGFLAENADFARAVIDAGLTWIGPSPETITALGDKVAARDIAMAVDAPLAPGTDGPVADAAEARAFAEEHGLPVVIKAAHGGGGRGMRVVRSLDEIEDAFDSASREAIGAFGNGDCFVERFLDTPRHVEAQVAADVHGNAVVIGTRDCSLQRRHQKLVEEAPAPFLSSTQEEQIVRASANIFKRAGYVGVGTTEFLVAVDGAISFLEVNTRIQVEHPITEEVTGVDLVQLQFALAAGEPLPFTQMPEPRGHAFEFRINAEDPARGFLPAAGEITSISVPTGPGIRWDSGVRAGTVSSGDFDSLLAKLIVSAPTRQQAIRRARQALRQLEIQGISTVIDFHRRVMEHPDFTSNDGLKVYTTWIENELGDDLLPDENYRGGLLPVGATSFPGTGVTRFNLEVNGVSTQVGIPDSIFASFGNSAGAGNAGGEVADARAPEVTSPMSGNLLRFEVAVGDSVETGQQVAVLEAMKTEVPVTADVSGVVSALPVEPGTRVNAGQVLVQF